MILLPLTARLGLRWFSVALLFCAVHVLLAQGPILEAPQAIPVGEPSVALTITLRPVMFLYQIPTNLLAPIWVAPGTNVRLQLGTWANPGNTFDWYRGGQRLATGTILDLGKVTADSAGTYGANQRPDPAAIIPITQLVASETVTLRVGQPPARSLVNASTLARITLAQPSFTSGVIVAARPENITSTFLIRAVGPGLARYVADPLAAPKLKVLDARGAEVAALLPVSFDGSDPMVRIAQQVGAFPLPAGGKDAVQLVSLAAGAYTVQVSAADGGSGTALLEIYEVPL